MRALLKEGASTEHLNPLLEDFSNLTLLETDVEEPYRISDRHKDISYGNVEYDPRRAYEGSSISLSAPAPVRLATRQNLGNRSEQDGGWKTAEVARRIVEIQLALHEMQEKAMADGDETKATKGWSPPSSDGNANSVGRMGGQLFQASLKKIENLLAEDLDAGMESIEGLDDGVIKDAIVTSHRVPFATFMSGQRKNASRHQTCSIDDWVLANEHHLRFYTYRHPESWSSFLVPLTNLASIFSSTPSMANANPDKQILTFPRLKDEDFPGYSILNLKSPDSRSVHLTTESFQKTWNRMTGGILDGLDWNNVCVAGGFPLAVLLNVPKTNAEEQAEADEKLLDSDIDLYLIGLSTPSQLNAKLNHIEQVYRSNLPSGKNLLVTQNSRTVTFFCDFPIRRVQVILKRMKTLAEVILNFDLDPCAIAFNGKEVWLLPRAVRALQTSCSVFTMDMPEGHWLGDRRESQEQRVFKYADRGFGIHFLPSYMVALSKRGLSLPKIADKTRQRSTKYYSFPEKLLEDNIPEYMLDGNEEENDAVRRAYENLSNRSHADLDRRGGNAAEPGNRNCLTCFDLLMRHVTLWEAEVGKRLRIKRDQWASDIYARQDGGFSYDDAPKYNWDESFNLEDFKREIDRFNREEWSEFRENLEAAGVNRNEAYIGSSERSGSSFNGDNSSRDIDPNDEQHMLLANRPHLQRMAYDSTLSEVFSSHVVLALFLPVKFAEFARKIVGEAIKDEKNGLSQVEGLMEDGGWLREGLKEGVELEVEEDEEELRLYYWMIGKELMWQKVDRRIDEIFELLWTYFRANANLRYDVSAREHMFRVGATRRAARPTRTPKSEKGAFCRWVETRGPNMDTNQSEPNFYTDDEIPEDWED